jgi:predicted MPP superfamily phosphohydrolase
MISRRQFLRWTAGLGLSAALVPAYAFVIGPLLPPRITRYTVAPRRWPAGLELNIAVLADFHACEPWMSPSRMSSIVQITNRLGADLIVLLGDYAAGHRFVTEYVDSSDWSAALAGLRAPLGVHAVLGNHDWWEDRTAQRNGEGPIIARRALEHVGIPVYENDAVRLTKDGNSFWLAGLGDQVAFVPWRHRYPGRPMGVDDLAATLAKIPADEEVVLLAHETDVMVRVPDRVALVLSGHTHGGQVRLFGWSPVVPSRYGNRYAYGHVREQCDLIVSGGLGCSVVPLRFGVPPEIVLVTLRSNSSTAPLSA